MKKEKNKLSQRPIGFDAKTNKRVDSFMSKEHMLNFSEAVRILVNKGCDAEGIK